MKTAHEIYEELNSSVEDLEIIDYCFADGVVVAETDTVGELALTVNQDNDYQVEFMNQSVICLDWETAKDLFIKLAN